MTRRTRTPIAPLMFRAVRLAAVMMIGFAPAAASPAAPPASSFQGADTVEMPRMVVTGLGKGGEAGESVTFVPVLETSPDSVEAARALLPAYRDVILVTTVGYLAFAANHGRPVEPERLQRLLADRIEASGLPRVTAVMLQSFVFKPPPPTN